MCIRDSSCGASKSIAGALRPGALKSIGYKCKGGKPWLGIEEDTEHPCQCDASKLRVVQRGASNVWFADTRSSIYIPTDNDALTRRMVEIVNDPRNLNYVLSHRVNGELDYDIVAMIAEMEMCIRDSTKYIGDEIKCITGFDSAAYIWSKVEGTPVEHRIFNSPEDQRQQLEALINKLISDGVSAGNITILSPYKRENSIVSEVSGIKIKDYTPRIDNVVSFSTIQALSLIHISTQAFVKKLHWLRM